MKIGNSIFIQTLFLSLFLSNTTLANSDTNNPENSIDALITDYGKQAIIELILDIRASKITIDVDGELEDTYGRPSKDMITTRSILSDIEKAGLDIDAFSIKLDEYQQEQQQRSQRHYPSDEQSITTNKMEKIEESMQEKLDEYKKRDEERAKIKKKSYDRCINTCKNYYDKCVNFMGSRYKSCLNSGLQSNQCEGMQDINSCENELEKCTQRCEK